MSEKKENLQIENQLSEKLKEIYCHEDFYPIEQFYFTDGYKQYEGVACQACKKSNCISINSVQQKLEASLKNSKNQTIMKIKTYINKLQQIWQSLRDSINQLNKDLDDGQQALKEQETLIDDVSLFEQSEAKLLLSHCSIIGNLISKDTPENQYKNIFTLINFKILQIMKEKYKNFKHRFHMISKYLQEFQQFQKNEFFSVCKPEQVATDHCSKLKRINQEEDLDQTIQSAHSILPKYNFNFSSVDVQLVVQNYPNSFPSLSPSKIEKDQQKDQEQQIQFASINNKTNKLILIRQNIIEFRKFSTQFIEQRLELRQYQAFKYFSTNNNQQFLVVANHQELSVITFDNFQEKYAEIQKIKSKIDGLEVEKNDQTLRFFVLESNQIKIYEIFKDSFQKKEFQNIKTITIDKEPLLNNFISCSTNMIAFGTKQLIVIELQKVEGNIQEKIISSDYQLKQTTILKIQFYLENEENQIIFLIFDGTYFLNWKLNKDGRLQLFFKHVFISNSQMKLVGQENKFVIIDKKELILFQFPSKRKQPRITYNDFERNDGGIFRTVCFFNDDSSNLAYITDQQIYCMQKLNLMISPLDFIDRVKQQQYKKIRL